jgi:hypothetical protein
MAVTNNYQRFGPLGGATAGIDTARERKTEDLDNYVQSLQAQANMLQMIEAAETLRLKKKYGEQEAQANLRNLKLEGDEALSRMDQLAAAVDESRQNIEFGPRRLKMDEDQNAAQINNLNAEILKFDDDRRTNASQRSAYGAEVESRNAETALKKQEHDIRAENRQAAFNKGQSMMEFEADLESQGRPVSPPARLPGMQLTGEVATNNVNTMLANDEELSSMEWGGPTQSVDGDDISLARSAFANAVRQEADTYAKEQQALAIAQGSPIEPILDENEVTTEAYARAKRKYLSINPVSGTVYYVAPVQGHSAFEVMDAFDEQRRQVGLPPVRNSIEIGDVEGIRALFDRLNAGPNSQALLQHMFPWMDIEAIKKRGLSGSLFDRAQLQRRAAPRPYRGQNLGQSLSK